MTAKAAFTAMGCIILFSSILSMFVFIPGQSGLFWKTTVPSEPVKTVEVVAAIEEGDKEKTSHSVASKDSETHAADLSDHASHSSGESL